MIDMWQERTILLTKLIQPVWVRGKEQTVGQEREKSGILEREARERSSTFSLEFSAIGLSIFGEARSKVAPHDKGYKWVPVLWSFEKLREVGVFLLLVFLLV